MAECFYCFADKPLTRAHLFQKGFRKTIEDATGGVFLSDSSVSHPGIVRAIKHGGDIRETKVTSLCEDCNNNWMNNIELAAETAFSRLVSGEYAPSPHEFRKIAHWAVVFAALSSELHPKLQIPPSHRQAIRQGTLIPDGYSTYVVWTKEHLVTVQSDLYRAVSASTNDSEVHWFHLLHLGSVVLITATPGLTPRVARVLNEANIHSALGFIGDSFVYVPQEFQRAMTEGHRAEHQELFALGPKIGNEASAFITTSNGIQVLDLSEGMQFGVADFSFDFGGQLFDYRQPPGSN
ncbi:hypothetical protein QFZ60_000036 [Arthrobacter sp. B2I5]|uniref:hypothetical protein n=1 Tax=Arthrobacter sp. B2I5 TaxID=3042266 RepID=UPI0027873AB0|nr:hypothetical protein [Arthrobacter sp. B2I5]MDQ0823863.1 hypothetical protein [Arthrobacter sp. B2I5]